MVKIREFLKNVADSQSFFLKDGRTLRNILELRDALKYMNADVFSYHVNDYKNDFANWVMDVIKDAQLAQSLYAVKNQHDMFDIIDKRIDYIRATESGKPISQEFRELVKQIPKTKREIMTKSKKKPKKKIGDKILHAPKKKIKKITKKVSKKVSVGNVAQRKIIKKIKKRTKEGARTKQEIVKQKQEIPRSKVLSAKSARSLVEEHAAKREAKKRATAEQMEKEEKKGEEKEEKISEARPKETSLRQKIEEDLKKLEEQELEFEKLPKKVIHEIMKIEEMLGEARFKRGLLNFTIGILLGLIFGYMLGTLL